MPKYRTVTTVQNFNRHDAPANPDQRPVVDADRRPVRKRMGDSKAKVFEEPSVEETRQPWKQAKTVKPSKDSNPHPDVEETREPWPQNPKAKEGDVSEEPDVEETRQPWPQAKVVEEPKKKAAPRKTKGAESK